MEIDENKKRMMNLPANPTDRPAPPSHEKWDVPPPITTKPRSPITTSITTTTTTTTTTTKLNTVKQILPLESLTSDASMDIADITMEVEKIGKEKENPEEAIRDSNRLLKEIDHQMEMSFEIMEERNNMVREYLKEREKSERKYKTKADRMMEAFNNKMSMLENSLTLNESTDTGGPTIKSSYTQTFMQIFKEAAVQTSEGKKDGGNFQTSPDFEEAVAALTEDIQKAVASQYAKERKILYWELAAKKNKMDQEAIENTINELNGEFQQELRAVAINLATEYMDTTKQEMKDANLEELVSYFQNSEDENSLDNRFKEKQLLKRYKSRYQSKAHDHIKNGAKAAEEKLINTIKSLQTCCLEIDKLQNRYTRLLKEISNATGFSDQEVEMTLKQIKEEKQENEKQLLMQKLIGSSQSSEMVGLTRGKIEDALAYFMDVKLKEDILKNSILPELASSQESYWKQQLANAHRNMETMVKEKEDLLQQINKENINIEGNYVDKALTIQPNANIYFQPVRVDFEEQEKVEEFISVEPKIGKQLMDDLVRMENGSKIQAIEVIKYQEKPIEEILKDYENDITEFCERTNKLSAYKEVTDIISGKDITNELISQLNDEQNNVRNKMADCNTSLDITTEQLARLKTQKDKILAEEARLKNQKDLLKKQLVQINKEIADELVEGGRERECLNTENRLLDVTEQIEELQNSVSKMENDETDGKRVQGNSIASISQRLNELRRNLEKLLPFVNDSVRQKIPRDPSSIEPPSSETIEKLLETKSKLSKRLLDTEKKIQEIITSDGYESSIGSGTMENIEEMQRDPSSSPTERLRRSSPNSPQNLNLDLNNKLLNVEMELARINEDIKTQGIENTDCAQLEIIYQQLSTSVREMEARLSPSSQIPGSLSKGENVNAINKEITKLRQELQEKGEKEMHYDKYKEENILRAKEAAIDKLKQMREDATANKTECTISVALKDLLEERDRTTSIIIALNEDIETLEDVKKTMGDGDEAISISNKISDTNKLLLEKKADNVTKMVAIARNKLGYFINLVKIKMKERLDEASKANWINRNRLTKEEKQKLGKELRDAVTEIKTMETDLQNIADYKQTGTVDISDTSSSTLNDIFQEKNSLVLKLQDIDRKIQSSSKTPKNKALVNKWTAERIEIMEQLVELEERINSQDAVLKHRLEKFKEIKQGLEKKLADAVDVNDLKQIIAELDKKESPRFLDLDNEEGTGEGSLVSLMKERKTLTDNILQVIHSSPHESGKIQRMNNVLEGIDVDILTHIDEILTSLDAVPEIEVDKRMEAFELLSTTANAFKFLKDKGELECALHVMGAEDERSANIDLVRIQRKEISTLEQLKTKLGSFQNRAIDINNLNEIQTFKNMNEEKLNRLLTKIKNLNQLVDTRKKLDRKAKSIEELTVGDLQQMSLTTDMINSELQSIVKCYENEFSNNDNNQQENPYLRQPMNPKLTSDSLSMLLEKRDEKLNKLFLVEKELEENHSSSDGKKRQLQGVQEVLTREIEVIDESIVNCQYMAAAKNDSPVKEHGSPSRSFSPRSTSSRTSFTVYMEERDHILRELFQLEKQEENYTADDVYKHSPILEITTQKDQLATRLKQLTKRMLGDRSNIFEPQESSNTGKIAQNLHKNDINKALEEIQYELGNNKIFLHRGDRQNQDQQDVDGSSMPFTNPPELECLEDIRRFEKKLNLESMKKALQSLEEEKRIIEENMAAGNRRTQTHANTRKTLDEARQQLNHNKEKMRLLKKKQELQKSLKDLRENIENNDKLSDKIDEMDHKEFVKHENEISLREHKQNKIKLEQELDQINNALYHYVYSLEDEIDNIKKQQHEIDVKETLKALKEHQSDLKDRVVSNNKYLAGKSKIPLPKLLSARRKTCNELNSLNEEEKNKKTDKEKIEVTESLRGLYDQRKQLENMTTKLRHKHDLLSKRIKELSASTAGVNKSKIDSEKFKKALGKDLFNLIQNPNDELKCIFSDLNQCLEDRTLEVYVKELENLNKLQNEQMNHLKDELKKALANHQAVRKEEEVNMKSLLVEPIQSEHHEPTTNDFEEMIQKLQDELLVAEEMRNKFKLKLGEKLYDTVTNEQSNSKKSVAFSNFGTKLDRYLENLKGILNRNEANLEQLLEQNINDIENLTQENESSSSLVNKLQEEKAQLAKNLHDRDEQIDLLRKLDEHCSETESYRDILLCQTSVEKEKEDLRAMAERINILADENKILQDEKVIITERESALQSELKTLKSSLEDSAQELTRLSETEKSQQTELESVRKKLKKMTREKTALQENLERELKNIDSLQEDLNVLQQKDKQAVHDMHRNCQIIEKHERETKRLKEVITQAEKSNTELQASMNELKEKYQTLSNKYQTETLKMNKELRNAKTKISGQQLEIERIRKEEQEDGEHVQHLQNAIEFEKNAKENLVKEYKLRLDEAVSKSQSMNINVVELKDKVKELDTQNHNLTNENQVLLTKLKDLDESFENEIAETRRELSEKFNSTIDKMNEKVRDLANELVRLEKEKQELVEQNLLLKDQRTDQMNDINEQRMMLDSQGKTQALKLLSINTELESFRLENDELRDQILALKKQLKQKDLQDNLTKTLDQKRDQLTRDLKQFEEDKRKFEESLQDFVLKQQSVNIKSKSEDKVSVKLLTATQEERDALSNELIKSNRELHVTKNELRKLKMNLREKEQDFTEDEKRIIRTIEEDCKRKMNEQSKNHKQEKDEILLMYNEERNKWEYELEKLKQDLQEETLKKLAEQRSDYEKELEKQVQLYIKQNEEELEEERDKNNMLEDQKLKMIEQFEEEKTKVLEKNELQRQTMVGIIKRLLKHLMLLKKQRTRLRNSYEDEISELEERLESEKKRLAEQKQKELQIFKDSLKATTNELNSSKPFKNTSGQDPLQRKVINNNNANRIRPEKENDASLGGDYKLSLSDLRDLIRMGDLKDIIDSDYEEEKEMLQKSMREQYEVKLRTETDYLMKRLLELSDELDALRATH